MVLMVPVRGPEPSPNWLGGLLPEGDTHHFPHPNAEQDQYLQGSTTARCYVPRTPLTDVLSEGAGARTRSIIVQAQTRACPVMGFGFRILLKELLGQREVLEGSVLAGLLNTALQFLHVGRSAYRAAQSRADGIKEGTWLGRQIPFAQPTS